MKLSKTHEERVAASGVWRKKFALFPTCIDDGSVIWLEWYEVMDEYRAAFGRMYVWITHERRIPRSGTNSAGPGGPTSVQREHIKGIM